ncbi:MAG: hypothetical protein ABI461_13070 [Polyangiaceae bacterium]
MKRPAQTFSGMYDVAALVLLAFSCVAYVLGGTALARTDDFMAAYWLLVGVVTMAGSIKIAKNGGGRG